MAVKYTMDDINDNKQYSTLLLFIVFRVSYVLKFRERSEILNRQRKLSIIIIMNELLIDTLSSSTIEENNAK